MKATKHLIRFASLGLLLSAFSFLAHSQEYPAKPIKLVVPYAAGAITDLGARLIADRMSVILGQQVIIDNRGGAGTRIGMQMVASAPADGYTLLFANSVTHGTMPAMSKSLAFDPIKDFLPVARVFTYTSTLVCHPSFAATNVAELIAFGKQNPEKITNATAGPGTGHDFMGGLFNSLTGANMLQVHYRGAAPALQDVLSGTTNCIFGGGDVKQHVQSGKVRVFATSGASRDPDFPDIPTMEQAGVKGFVVTWWQGLAAPAGTPAPVIARLNAAAIEALKSPEVLAKAKGLSLFPSGSTPQQMGQLIRDDMALYSKIVKDAKIPMQD